MNTRDPRIKNKELKFWVVFLLAIAFGLAGMFCPPLGVIDSSVLVLVGQLLVFAASIIGLDIMAYYKYGNRNDKE